jgi:protoheme IX farnesyltransferase
LIRPADALVLGIGTVLAALVFFTFLCGWRAAALGLLVVAWYNGLYTWLKRRTAFAVVPGALIGSLGPAIGWVSAGGSSFSSGLFSVMFLFCLWQVPHLWLLDLSFPDDYRSAGYPSPTATLGVSGLGRLVFVWTAATAVATLMLPLFGLIRITGLYAVLFVASFSMAWLAGGMLREPEGSTRRFRRGFAGINLYMIVTMLLLLLERGIGR